jgi:small subunit ribosomal protein S27Ae
VQVFTKPKKEKHVHKKVKMRVLNYYEVDDNQKVTRKRREW